ncbi:chitinase-3-like protein 1 [Biomphalaria glabrata]|uniref:Chitinase-3-like protein 1 n=1 Tax=Biomphalaria glabrata TaxID=6526 RepID=A0A9W2ZIH0_BIOGL|nr:chitinase-3-like protein 1 [Biomphalaria glabrata]
MSRLRKMFLQHLVLVLCLSCTTGHICKNILCYFTTDSTTKDEFHRFHPMNINPFLCTHIVYYYALISRNELHLSEQTIQSNDTEIPYYTYVNNQKESKSDLKTLVSVIIRLSTFFVYGKDSKARQTFIQNLRSFLRKHDFDGVEINWSTENVKLLPVFKTIFTTLIQEIAMNFREERRDDGKKRLILAVSVSPLKDVIDKVYDVHNISSYVDMLNIETTRFRTGSELTVGHYSPLYGDYRLEVDTNCVDFSVKYWLKNGAPSKKLNIGLGLFGLTYQTEKYYRHYIGNAALGPGRIADQELDICTYTDVNQFLSWGAKIHRSKDQEVPHFVLNDLWVGYEDQISLNEKVNYVLQNQLAGVTVWSFDMDDFRGDFSLDGPYPLMTTIKKACEDFAF